jgi:hypothetical protein
MAFTHAKYPARRTLFLSGCLPLILVLASCSGASDTPDGADNAAEDPPGAALPLSIGGRTETAGDDPFAVAVNCAAALDQTAERLAQMANNPRSEEIALLGRAAKHFEANANKEAMSGADQTDSSPAAAIARRRQEKTGEMAEQAQLAIACLRRFGDDIGAATGSDTGL